MKPVAIIGLSPTRREAPEPDGEWELWGLGNDPNVYRYDRIFEIHTDDSLTADQLARVKAQRVEFADRIVLPEAFPFKDIEAFWPYGLDSSPAYMLAMAMLENRLRIGIWGVDMASDDEYACQRDNMLMLLGFARGRGFDVILPEASKLNLPKRYYPHPLADFVAPKWAPPVPLRVAGGKMTVARAGR